MKKIKIIIILGLLLNNSNSQIKLSISEYRPFPDQISILEIEPTKISWSIANRFLLMDQYQKDLIELGCSKVASEIKGLTSEQIKEKFGFDDDVFTEDEKNQLNLNAKYSPKNKDDNNDDKDLNV